MNGGPSERGGDESKDEGGGFRVNEVVDETPSVGFVWGIGPE